MKLIDFYSKTCGPCKLMARILDEFSQENPKIGITKIDIAENPEIAQEYSVRSVPTIVFVDETGEVHRETRPIPKAHVEEIITKLKG